MLPLLGTSEHSKLKLSPIKQYNAFKRQRFKLLLHSRVNGCAPSNTYHLQFLAPLASYQLQMPQHHSCLLPCSPWHGIDQSGFACWELLGFHLQNPADKHTTCSKLKCSKAGVGHPGERCIDTKSLTSSSTSITISSSFNSGGVAAWLNRAESACAIVASVLQGSEVQWSEHNFVGRAVGRRSVLGSGL